MTTINKIAKIGLLGGLLMGAVSLKATNPITKTNNTQNQTEIVSKEGAAALRAASVQGIQQKSVLRNQRLDNTFRKFGSNAEELRQINVIMNDVYKKHGTFMASAMIQHELDRQQLYLLLKQVTKKLAKINPDLAKEVTEIGDGFYNGIRNNDVDRVEKWLNEEYTPSVLGVLYTDHKPTGEEMIKIIDEVGETTYRDYEELFYTKLIQRKVDFNRITQCYIQYLQQMEDMNKKQLAIVDIPLIEVLTDDKRNEKYRKDYIARYLKKYGRCDGMPFIEDLNKIVEEHKLNLDGDYYHNLYL